MKTNNSFDYLQNENTIPDESIIVNTGVKTENVMKIVNEKLSEEFEGGKIMKISTKKRTGKIIGMVFAAAVLAAAVTAQAMGSFKESFGSFIIGESPDGIYSGDNLSLTSENSNVEFLGIAGDKNTAAVSVKITKKDGSPFIDDIENTWISTTRTDECDTTFYGGVPSAKIELTRSAWSDLTDRAEVMSGAGFYFTDNATVNAYILLNGDEGGIMGETLTADVSDLTVYTVCEVLYDFSEEYVGYEVDNQWFGIIQEYLQKYGYKPIGDKYLMVNPENRDIVLAKAQPLDIDFTLSVDMNYISSSKTIEFEDPSGFDPRLKSAKAEVQPFTIKLTGVVDTDKLSSDESDIHISDYEEIKITMSDGSVVTGYWQDFDSTDGEVSALYRYYTGGENGKRLSPTAINPNDVVSVEMVTPDESEVKNY